MIFNFESDFAGSLRCIPMITRQKLDIVAIKMSLRQWSKLSREERGQMTEQLCTTPQQVEAYRALVQHLIATKTDEPVMPLTVQNLEDWQQTDHVPDAVLAQASSDGISPPDLNTWQKLTPLQRFALIKLARSKHENENFVPAMKEFGILPSEK